MWQMEQSLLGVAEQLRQRTGAVVASRRISQALKRNPDLSQEQVAAVRGLLESSGSLKCLTGVAGAGKTKTLNSVREAYEAEGYRVIGTALDFRIPGPHASSVLVVWLKSAQCSSPQKWVPDHPRDVATHFMSGVTDPHLTGNSSHFEARRPSPEFKTWIGHEIRYVDKQRLYVAQWRADLDNSEFDGKIPSVENSFVSEAVRDLLSLVLGAKSAWEEYVDGIKTSVASDTNYCENLKKHKTLKKTDYRVPDFRSKPQIL